ncbi:MAG: ThiF family adenylyltransferase [Verrucomicrobiaceae bacterium]
MTASFQSDVHQAVEALGGGLVRVIETSHLGRNIPAICAVLGGEVELILIASDYYPGIPPVILCTTKNGPTEQLQFEWSLQAETCSRLLTALRQHFRGSGEFRPYFGPNIGRLLTSDHAIAEKLGWRKFFSAEAPANMLEPGALFERSRGILTDELSTCHAMIVGLGSGGSYVAEQLARVGLGNFTLIDPDFVESANLSRTSFLADDIGRPKVEAVQQRIEHINPLASVKVVHSSLAQIGITKLSQYIENTDIVLALTDDPTAQATLNHLCYHFGKPGVFAGLYTGASGGEVILALPGRTPCVECATGGVRSAVGAPPDRVSDYGTSRLEGVQALSADIHHLDTATIKLTLSILLAASPSASISRFASDAVDLGFSYLIMSMEPEYWIFPHIFQNVPGQYAYQAAWFTVQARNNCTVCGSSEFRENPTTLPIGVPNLRL